MLFFVSSEGNLLLSLVRLCAGLAPVVPHLRQVLVEHRVERRMLLDIDIAEDCGPGEAELPASAPSPAAPGTCRSEPAASASFLSRLRRTDRLIFHYQPPPHVVEHLADGDRLFIHIQNRPLLGAFEDVAERRAPNRLYRRRSRAPCPRILELAHPRISPGGLFDLLLLQAASAPPAESARAPAAAPPARAADLRFRPPASTARGEAACGS